MTSPQLYDAGEEFWPVKIHAACGGIYLRGYTNIDIAGQLASEAPDLAKRNEADITDYYARLDLTPEQRRPNVVDRIANMERLFPQMRESVNKIICIQALEHLSPLRAVEALGHWHFILAPNGVLIVSVPDMDGTLEWAGGGRADFALRHLRGSGRDEYNWHRSWWTKESLTEALWSAGFWVEWLANFHDYPALVIKGRKQ